MNKLEKEIEQLIAELKSLATLKDTAQRYMNIPIVDMYAFSIMRLLRIIHFKKIELATRKFFGKED